MFGNDLCSPAATYWYNLINRRHLACLDMYTYVACATSYLGCALPKFVTLEQLRRDQSVCTIIKFIVHCFVVVFST